MDVHAALRTRRTIHAYVPGPVPDEVVHRALEAAHHAPCHKLTWPWRFTLVGLAVRQQLAEHAVEVKAAKKGTLSPAQQAAIRAKALNPGVLIVVSQVRCDDPTRRREDYAACAAAIQNLQLSAHADGYGTKWSTGGTTRTARTYELVQVDAGSEEIIGFVWLGKAAAVPSIARPPVSELVRRV